MDSDKTYLINYQKYFNPLVDKKIALLELGVFKGESIRFWRDYFLHGKIYGVDIKHVDIEDQTGRVQIFKGSQCDIKFLDSISTNSGPYDIIIDDASHIGEYTKISFWHLFNNYLKSGGIYVIEDWGTGYYKNFPDGKIYTDNRTVSSHRTQKTITFLIDRLNVFPPSQKRLKKALLRILNIIRVKLIKKKFTSHNYGLVGFIKELVDEMGMEIITSPRGNPKISSTRKFENIDIYPGQIFITKMQ